MSVFDFGEYKQFLRDQIHRNEGRRGYNTRLAEAAGCSRSFLSQVLSSDVDFTRDHAAGLSAFWNFQPLETEYFFALVDLARAKSPVLSEYLRQRLKTLKSDQASLTKRVQKEGLDEEHVGAVYYSTWLISAVHVCLTIPRLVDPESIARRLTADVRAVEKALSRLAEIGLAQQTAQGWKPKKADLNVADHSPFSQINHANWRNKAIASLPDRKSESVHFSSVFTMSAKDAESLRQQVRDFLVKARETIVASPEEEVFCMNLDFFEL